MFQCRGCMCWVWWPGCLTCIYHRPMQYIFRFSSLLIQVASCNHTKQNAVSIVVFGDCWLLHSYVYLLDFDSGKALFVCECRQQRPYIYLEKSAGTNKCCLQRLYIIEVCWLQRLYIYYARIFSWQSPHFYFRYRLPRLFFVGVDSSASTVGVVNHLPGSICWCTLITWVEISSRRKDFPQQKFLMSTGLTCILQTNVIYKAFKERELKGI
jgi:hypothetical protein